MALGIAGSEELYLPATGGRNYLAGRDCQDQTRRNEFEVDEGRSPVFFMLLYGSEAVCILVSSKPHIYVHYAMAERKTFTELIRLEEVAILA